MFITAVYLLFLLKLKWPKNKSVYNKVLYDMLILLANRTLFNIKVLIKIYGEELTKDPIGRLKTRHYGLMWPYLSDKCFSMVRRFL